MSREVSLCCGVLVSREVSLCCGGTGELLLIDIKSLLYDEDIILIR